MEEIIRCCQNLKEVDLAYEFKKYENEYFEFLVKNMPPNVEKLNLGDNLITNDEVKTLLSRCKKIKALNLQAIRITDDSLMNIKQHLNLTLEELSLSDDFISFNGFLGLKSMPRLIILNLLSENDDSEKIQNLKQHLSHLMIKVSSPFES